MATGTSRERAPCDPSRHRPIGRTRRSARLPVAAQSAFRCRSRQLPPLHEPRLDFSEHSIPVEVVARPAVMPVDLQRELSPGEELRNEIATVAVVRPGLDGNLALLARDQPPQSRVSRHLFYFDHG